MVEIWRDIPSLPEYQASSLGRIQRIPYEAPMPNGGTRIYGGKAWAGTCTVNEPCLRFRFRGKTYKVGDVVEHERGYRAERAAILSIDDVTWRGKPPWDKETAEVLRFLRERYGVGGE